MNRIQEGDKITIFFEATVDRVFSDGSLDVVGPYDDLYAVHAGSPYKVLYERDEE